MITISYVTPSSRSTGDIITAAIWNQDVVSNSQASVPDIFTAQGDMVYATAADTAARLAKGTANQMLRMNSGATAPEWATLLPASGAFMGAAAADRHVEYGESTNDSVAQGATDDDAYTFANAFGSNPAVVTGLEHNGAASDDATVIVKTATRSTTGVTLQKYNNKVGGLSMISYMVAVGAD